MKEGRKPEYPEKTPDDELQQLIYFFSNRMGHLASAWNEAVSVSV